MKLIVAVVQGIDGDLVAEALTARGFEATQIDSAGGFPPGAKRNAHGGRSRSARCGGNADH